MISDEIKIEDYEGIIQCDKLEPTELNNFPNLEIKIFAPEKHSGGFFSKAYITYLIQTLPIGLSVRRRYSDFEWLKSILSALFPGLMVYI